MENIVVEGRMAVGEPFLGYSEEVVICGIDAVSGIALEMEARSPPNPRREAYEQGGDSHNLGR